MYPDYITVDCETTGTQNGTHGNPFTDSNRLCVIGYGNSTGGSVINLIDESTPSGPKLHAFRNEFENGPNLFVGFNCKFDLHWLRRYGISLTRNQNVWDCQLAHFIIHDQQHPLPSLEETALYYDLESKQTDIKTEYWDKGIDTDAIPFEIVRGRVESDVRITSKLFELQIDFLRKEPSKKNLIWLACQDQKVLQEMEYAGLKYDIALSLEEGNKIRARQKEIEDELNQIAQIDGINWNSKDHLSYVLYGGDLKLSFKEQYTFVYKDGSTALKTRWATKVFALSRRVEPIRGTEYAKGGVFSTDADSLSKLKPSDGGTRKIIAGLQEYRALDKKVGTYYHGIPKLYEAMNWTNNIIHGNLNSSVTRTGRLSSSKPNQQNMDADIRKALISRYE